MPARSPGEPVALAAQRTDDAPDLAQRHATPGPATSTSKDAKPLAQGDSELMAMFAWDVGDEAGRRLAAVQLVRLRAASQGQVAEAFGVDPATIWRWDQALAGGGVAGLVPARRTPQRYSGCWYSRWCSRCPRFRWCSCTGTRSMSWWAQLADRPVWPATEPAGASPTAGYPVGRVRSRPAP
jgi:hypothetical protein